MFQIGEKVIYGIHGACVVAGQEEKCVDHKMVTYLVLEPLKQDGSRFLVPSQNPAALAKLRRMLTQKDLCDLLESQQIQEGEWIMAENLRKQHYRELIAKGDRMLLMQMVHAIYRHKAEQAAAGRKCHLCDENFLRDAEKLLSEEIALVMEIEQNDARQFLRSKLQ